jgi:hypothetical protein
VGGADEALSPAELDALSEALFGSRHQAVAAGALPRGAIGKFVIDDDPVAKRNVYSILVDRGLAPEIKDRVVAHELGHGIGYFADPVSATIPQKGLKRELRQSYHDLNDGTWRRGKETPAHLQTRPEDSGYRGDAVAPEYTAEAIRANLGNPNYVKTVAPATAKAIRTLNDNPYISKFLWFNAVPAIVGGGVAGAAFDQEAR